MYFCRYFVVITFLPVFLYTLYSFVLSIPFSSHNNILTNCTIHCTTPYLFTRQSWPWRTNHKRHCVFSHSAFYGYIIRLEDSPNCQYLLVIGIRNDDTGLGGRCMNNLTVTDIQRHMTGVTDQVSCLCISQSINCCTLAAVCGRGMRKAQSQFLILPESFLH